MRLFIGMSAMRLLLATRKRVDFCASFVKGDSPVRGNVATRQKGCASLRGGTALAAEGFIYVNYILILTVLPFNIFEF